MSHADQAAGLRHWAQSQATTVKEPVTATRVMMVLGLPHGAESDVAPVLETLSRWREQGQAWVMDPDAWRVVPLDVDSPHLTSLITQQKRWALWVGEDLNAFRRAYLTLKHLAQRGGPARLLLLHPPLVSRTGLLGNLQQAAAEFLGIQLLVVDPPRRRRCMS